MQLTQEHVVEFSKPERPLSGPQPVTSVQGRLWKNFKFWINELEASQFVTDIVTHGYRLPFLAFPPVCARNQRGIRRTRLSSTAVWRLFFDRTSII